MASTETAAGLRALPQIVTNTVKAPDSSWRDWIGTTDHKKIGIMYVVTAFIFFIIGGLEALLIRLQLGTPDNTLLTPEVYNQLFTVHGMTMVFLFVMPILAGFGNYIVPLMLGARDMAFPRLNALSYWLFLCGGIVFYASFLFSPPEGGWFAYAPLSLEEFLPGGGIDAWIFLIHLTGIASLLGAINLYVTIANMRPRGMGWGRLPLFCWATLVTSVLLIVTLPEIATAVTLLLTDRHFDTHFFNPNEGGSPILWQHLFWFFGHPEVYIMILPAFGIISEVLPVFSRKPLFGYKALAGAIVGIAFLGVLVWAHHMFSVPLPYAALIFFMLGSFVIAVPTGIKIFNWIATMWGGSLVFKTPLYYATGFLLLFVIGGVTGIILAMFPVNWQLTDTYFVIAHFHYVLVGGAMFSIFAGIYYWFPKMTGRMLSEKLGKASFWTMFIGFNTTFLIQHALGLSGMPRRIYEYSSSSGWATGNLISTIGSFILAVGILLTVINVAKSLKSGAKAGPDPWHGNTLEWYTTSPPPVNNFDDVPEVRSLEPMQDIRKEIEENAVRSNAGNAATT